MFLRLISTHQFPSSLLSRLLALTFFAFLLSTLSLGQTSPNLAEPWRNEVYVDEINSVRTLRNGNHEGLPLLRLESSDNLTFEFDLMSDGVRDYEYSIEHYNSDWTPSGLAKDDYQRGFHEARVQQINPSELTLTDYINYAVTIPNQDIQPLVSGNYKLLVYDITESEPVLVLSCRFFVLESSNWTVGGSLVRPSKASKDATHHEIDFSVDTKNTSLFSPQTDLKVYVLQNSRLDTKIGPLRPIVSRGNRHIFDYQDSVIFPAGMEFRFFDIRNLEFRSQQVEQLRRKNTVYEVTLRVEKDRSYRNYMDYTDFNGGYVLENTTRNQNYLQSEYCRVLFRLEKPQEIEDADVYVVGGFNDYRISEKYRMQYSATASVYFAELLLKQGYYNYAYAVVPRGQSKPSQDLSVEGNAYQTVNLYQFLVYFKSPSDRYDRLMCVGGLTSGGN